jgi:NADH-quinone oxidoreductase subunit E
VLSDEERRELDGAVTHYAERSSAISTALKIVQSHRGWLSDEAVADVAGYLGLTDDDIDSRTTFYNLLFRQPVGRHVILVCNSFACWELGYDDVRRHLEERLGVTLGGTTADGRFTLLPIVCLGACDVAPAMLVDEDLHGDLTPRLIDEILERYR